MAKFDHEFPVNLRNWNWRYEKTKWAMMLKISGFSYLINIYHHTKKEKNPRGTAVHIPGVDMECLCSQRHLERKRYLCRILVRFYTVRYRRSLEVTYRNVHLCMYTKHLSCTKWRVFFATVFLSISRPFVTLERWLNPHIKGNFNIFLMKIVLES